jgi:ubiquinone/menaquinone biosynthesis C-methylase UbiE
MTLDSTAQWHNRYRQQAQWTAAVRKYLLGKAGLPQGASILEVGCGTAAVLSEIENEYSRCVGLDLSYPSLQYARQRNPAMQFILGDGLSLPIRSQVYDLTFCHFLLMWVPEPGRIVKEMARVTKPGGSVIAFAEPDYGGRIDYPAELAILGEFQRIGLQNQGANTTQGRELAALFQDADLAAVESGVLGGQWSNPPDWEAWKIEWQVLETDLRTFQDPTTEENFYSLKELDRQAYIRGKRILYVPTFYAAGIVKQGPFDKPEKPGG